MVPAPVPLRWRRLALAAALATVAAALPSLPPGVRNWDNAVKHQLARNLVAGRGLVLTDPTPDDEVYVQPGRAGRRYAGYPPLAAVLAIPAVLAVRVSGAGAEGLPALLLLGAVAAAVVAWGRRAGASPRAAAAGAMGVAFASGLWAYAAHGYDVLVEVLALALVLWAARGARMLDWAVAGLAVGSAFATRYAAATLAAGAAAALLAGAAGRIRPVLARGLAFAAGVAPGIALVLWFNRERFGSPLTFYVPGALGSAAELSVPWFSVRHWEAILGLTVSPGKGIVWYAPPVLAALVAAPALLRRARVELLAIAGWGAAALLLVGRFAFWHGEWGWGPRYLAPAALVTAPLAWWSAERVAAHGRAWRAAAVAAAVAAVAIQAVPVVAYPVEAHFRFTLLRLAEEGALATAPITRPPVPADNRVLYYRPENSMIVSVSRYFSGALAGARSGRGFRLRLALAALVPLAATLLVLRAGWIAGAPRRAGEPAVDTPPAAG